MNIKEVNVRIHAKDSNAMARFLIKLLEIINLDNELIFEYSSKDSSIHDVELINTNKAIDKYEEWKKQDTGKKKLGD